MNPQQERYSDFTLTRVVDSCVNSVVERTAAIA